MNMLDFRRASLEEDLLLEGAGAAIRLPAIRPRLSAAIADASTRLGIRPVDVELGCPMARSRSRARCSCASGWATTTAS